MLNPVHKNNIYQFTQFMIGFAINIFCNAQTFDNVEHLIGFEFLQKNNGIAVADYDNDHDLDIFIVAKGKDGPDYSSLSRLFKNNNDGTFTDVTVDAGFINLFDQSEGFEGMNGLSGYKYGASWGDFNNDSYPDLFLTFLGKIQLWKNLGNGTFSNITSDAGFITSNGCANTTATWLDYNNDGLLDIYVADWNYCPTNSLYKNNGDETFSDVTLLTNIASDFNYPSYQAFPFDFNSDGYLDIYVTNDKGYPNKLYINSADESFTEQGANYGVNISDNDMGLAVGDFNKDGYFDLFVTAINNNTLLTNLGNNNFQDQADIFGVGNTLWSWGNRFADFDLDGDEDLFIANGFKDVGPQTNYYFRNNYPISNFADASIELGFNQSTMSIDANDFDYDNDGDLDLIVSDSNGSFLFFENRMLNFDDTTPVKNWVKINLEGTISNRDAIGATITVTTENSTYKRYHSGVGCLSQSLKPLHFGLNDDTEINSIKIKWPSGLVEIHYNLSPNTSIKFIENQGFEVLNISPSPKIYGCTDPNSCSYNPEATINDNSCVYLSESTISGPINPSVLSSEIYSYTPANPDTNLQWSVVGGDIISGNSTNEVTVKWHVATSASISVTESNSICETQPTTLQINLTMNNLPEHISIARLWNEVLLNAIRLDYARPTIHARNLFHASVVMFDIWAIYNELANPYLMGNTVHGYSNILHDFTPNAPPDVSIPEAISYAMYRFMLHRFEQSPGSVTTNTQLQFIMDQLGYDTSITDLDYTSGEAASLGNYVAETIINYGLQDGSREETGYDNAYYVPVNSSLLLENESFTPLADPNRWQPLSFDVFIDQSGNTIAGNTPDFLSPEWGNVNGFALSDEDKVNYYRDGHTFSVYHDPSDPPYLGASGFNEIDDYYKWGFTMVSIWQAHHDSNDGILWDISPNAIGNLDSNTFPLDFEEYSNFYNFFEGGTLQNPGHDINPFTNEPYQTNMVPRGDYTRVLAEYWADGPDSETPPGHWFSILNDVNDHPFLEKRFQGQGNILDPLEWDVKTYFIMGSGMHDSAIAAWSIKGWYDYIRPVSAIRNMAHYGQSTDPNLPNFDANGLPLIPNYIELIDSGDPLAGPNNEFVGKIKLYTWKGHSQINNPQTDVAGVGWILAKDWYPYQRPTFVTPPFAGFVSGHSTFSRTAADLLTQITGDAYFPGGMGEFVAKKDEFLVFEKGPSQDVKLQWATYRDASDQTSLSRIWGGIHPPFDDILGRKIGEQIAVDVFNQAVSYFDNSLSLTDVEYKLNYFPNPVNDQLTLNSDYVINKIIIQNLMGQTVLETVPNSLNFTINMSSMTSGVYFVTLKIRNMTRTIKIAKL